MKRRKTSSRRVSKRFAEILQQEERVVVDAWYWLEHALHWYALLFAVVGVLEAGRICFG